MISSIVRSSGRKGAQSRKLTQLLNSYVVRNNKSCKHSSGSGSDIISSSISAFSTLSILSTKETGERIRSQQRQYYEYQQRYHSTKLEKRFEDDYFEDFEDTQQHSFEDFDQYSNHNSVKREHTEERRKKKKQIKMARKANKNKKDSYHGSGEYSDQQQHSSKASFMSSNDDIDAVFKEDYEYSDDLFFSNEKNPEVSELQQEVDEGVVLPDISIVKRRMMNAVSQYKSSLKYIQGPQPTPELFDYVKVNAYDSNSLIKTVAQVVITNPLEASITCYDPSITKEVKKAILLQAGMDCHINEDESIRVTIPAISGEIREESVKLLKKKAESYRVRVRRIRQRAVNVAKRGKEGRLEGISKDDAYRVLNEIESATVDAIQKLNQMTQEKRHSIIHE